MFLIADAVKSRGVGTSGFENNTTIGKKSRGPFRII